MNINSNMNNNINIDNINNNNMNIDNINNDMNIDNINNDMNINTSDADAEANAAVQPSNSSIVDLLRFRGGISNTISNNGGNDHTTQSTFQKAFTVVDRFGQEIGSWTWDTLLDRADKIRHAILLKTDLSKQPLHCGSGPRVALVFRKSEMLDFLAAFFGCQMAGMTAVPITTIDQFEEMAFILSHTKTELVLTTEHNYKVLGRNLGACRLKGKDVKWPEGVTWWKTDALATTAAGERVGGSNSWEKRGSKVNGGRNNTDPTVNKSISNNPSSTSYSSSSSSSSSPSSSSSSKASSLTSSASSTTPSAANDLLPLPELAYIEYTKSPSGELKGVAISHRTILAQCQAISKSLQSNPRRQMRHNRCQATAETSAASQDEVTIQSPLSPMPSNLPQQQEPADVVLSWLEPRQQVGLILGGLLGVYRGSHTVFLHSGVTETVGLWERCAHRYGATLALGEYQGVNKLIQDRSSSLSSSSSSSTSSRKKVSISLKQLEAFLIDTVVTQPQMDLDLATKVLAPLGIASAEQVVVSMSSLPEHGGMILAMRDHLPIHSGSDKIDLGLPRSQQPHVQEISTPSETTCCYLLDREALKTNWIEVLATGQNAIDRALEMGVILVSAFGYSLPQATLAIVHPETTALCVPNTVGEIWVDSPSIPFGFWDLPKRSQSTFHALPLIAPAISSSADTVMPEVYDPVPTGFLRTGLLGGLIEGRVVVFGRMKDQIQQDVPMFDTVALEEGSYGAEGRDDLVSRALITEYHYAADLINTVLKRIIGFTSCTVFECVINREHVPVICAESPRCHQRADAIKLAEYVRQAMLDYHGLAPYCIAIAAPESLPRTMRHGKPQIHPEVCRKMLESGQLALVYLWTSVKDSLLNLPVGDDVAGGIWGPDALAARQAVVPVQTRTIQYSSCDYPKEVTDERTKTNLSQFQSLADLLVWRTFMNPDDIAFQTLDSQQQQFQQQQVGSSKDSFAGEGERGTKPLTFRKFGAKVVRIAAYIEKRGGFRQGDKVVLLFRTGSIEFIATLYAVWFLGLVPIPITAPEPARLYEDVTLLMGLLNELGSSNAAYLIGNSFTEDVMKLNLAQAHMKAYIGARQDAGIPTILNISKAPKIPKKNRRNLGRESGFLTPPKSALHNSAPALVAIHYSTDRRRTLVKMTHAGLMAQARTMKVQCQFEGGTPIVSCARSFVGMDLLLACVIGVYVGAATVLIPFADFEARPQVYFEAVEHFNARDVLVDCAMVEQSFGIQKPLSPASLLSCRSNPSPLPLLSRSSFPFNPSSVQNLLVLSESRPNLETIKILENQLCPLSSTAPLIVSSAPRISSFAGSGGNLERTRLNGMFGHLVNPIISSRSFMDIEPVRLHISLNALRRGLVEITTELDDPKGVWIEDSGIPVCGTTVAIVNPETSEICLSGEIGEIWVSSDANVQPYIGRTTDVTSDAIIDMTKSRFHARISPSAADDNGGGTSGDLQQRLQQQMQLGSKSYVRTGEVGFLWNYATPEFNDGQPTSLLFVLGAIGETIEVQGLLHFPADVEQTIESAHPNFAPGGSIVFQAEEAVVCVVTVRQAQQHSPYLHQHPHSPPTSMLMNQVLCVMHQVLDRHGFMPDVVALVGDGVLAKTRFHEKQRGKMLSLFMGAKMPLLYIHYSHGSLVVPEAQLQQQHQQHEQEQQGQLQHRYSTGELLLSLNGTRTFMPTPTATPTGMPGSSRHALSYNCSSSTSSSVSSKKSNNTIPPTAQSPLSSSSSSSSSSSISRGEDTVERSNDAIRASQSSKRSSLQPVRSVQAIVGSFFHGAKSTPLST
ncbi:MAG: hypothetical protein J3R72DRAFT_460915 [Linnemannia gamsii]|nr:MAG: hypothetical protein J3R72DRAFT_460915 [Linnemannia gamsii]